MKKWIFTVLLVPMIVAAQTTSSAPYCDAAFDDMGGFPVPDGIKKVMIGTLNNDSGGQYAAPHYVYYSNLTSPQLAKGSAYPLSMTFEVHGGCGYGAWIDYNHDNVFGTDEKVAGSTSSGTTLDITDNTLVTVNVTIPAGAMTGETRMRVRIVEDDQYNAQNSFVELPCNASASDTDVMDWGETEDYKVAITEAAAGLEEQTYETKTSLTNGLLTIIGEPAKTAVIVDLSGKVIRSFSGQQTDINDLLPGVYVLRTEAADGAVSGCKFLK